MKKRSVDNRFGEIDDHDMPTEPMAQVIFSPVATTSPIGEGIPMPQPPARPFPWQDARSPFPPPAMMRPSETSVYPVLPPLPVTGARDRPAGGAGPVRITQPHRSAVPMLVGLFFLAVQILLLVRFILDVLGLQRTALWMNVVYEVSSAFLLPFRLLLQSVTLPFSIGVGLYTVLAILIYGLFSRILVRLLKAFLHAR
ncbi:MAG: hypothetical protein M3Z08_11515 [Chloroflexota bacterium]|nr:hypothetical protein [Chloroflexota bacterium]